MSRRRYPTDLTDAQWTILEPDVPPPTPGGRPPKHSRRELVDAMRYIFRSGGAWRVLPHEFPPWQTGSGLGGMTGAGNGSTPRCASGSGAGPAAIRSRAGRSSIASRSRPREKGASRR